MRSVALLVVALSLSACGRSGDLGGLGSNNEGIQNNGSQNSVVPANGCVVPSSVKWSDPRSALENGATGDTCSFGGGAGNGAHIDFCMGHYLLIMNESSGDPSFCIQDGGGMPPAAKVSADCAESCFTSGGVFIDCVPSGVQPPNRQLPSPWSLNAQSDCDALMSGCPQIGDACSGSVICGGAWHPDQPSTATSWDFENAVMWCDSGSLKVVVNE